MEGAVFSSSFICLPRTMRKWRLFIKLVVALAVSFFICYFILNMEDDDDDASSPSYESTLFHYDYRPIQKKRQLLDFFCEQSKYGAHRSQEHSFWDAYKTHPICRNYSYISWEFFPKRPTELLLIRILGNDLPPRHSSDQTIRNLKFTLQNEPNQYSDRITKLWMLNRIYNQTKSELIITLLKKYKQPYIVIPISTNEYESVFYSFHHFNLSQNFTHHDFIHSLPYLKLQPKFQFLAIDKLYQDKNIYAINNNGGRNEALLFGKVIFNATWILPFDGNCYFTHLAMRELLNDIEMYGDQTLHFTVPMTRMLDNGLLKDTSNDMYLKSIAVEEPQIIFRHDSPFMFNENMRYGRRPKLELLWKLGYPISASYHHILIPWEPSCILIPQLNVSDLGRRELYKSVSWTARLFSGFIQQELSDIESIKKRNQNRMNAIHDFIDQLDALVIIKNTGNHFTSTCAICDFCNEIKYSKLKKHTMNDNSNRTRKKDFQNQLFRYGVQLLFPKPSMETYQTLTAICRNMTHATWIYEQSKNPSHAAEAIKALELLQASLEFKEIFDWIRLNSHNSGFGFFDDQPIAFFMSTKVNLDWTNTSSPLYELHLKLIHIISIIPFSDLLESVSILKDFLVSLSAFNEWVLFAKLLTYCMTSSPFLIGHPFYATNITTMYNQTEGFNYMWDLYSPLSNTPTYTTHIYRQDRNLAYDLQLLSLLKFSDNYIDYYKILWTTISRLANISKYFLTKDEMENWMKAVKYTNNNTDVVSLYPISLTKGMVQIFKPKTTYDSLNEFSVHEPFAENQEYKSFITHTLYYYEKGVIAPLFTRHKVSFEHWMNFIASLIKERRDFFDKVKLLTCIYWMKIASMAQSYLKIDILDLPQPDRGPTLRRLLKYYFNEGESSMDLVLKECNPWIYRISSSEEKKSGGYLIKYLKKASSALTEDEACLLHWLKEKKIVEG